MGNELTRRNFIKATSTAAGLAAAAGINPRSFAANEKIRLGIVGTGKQAQIAHLSQGLRVNSDQIQVVAICDVWSYSRDAATKILNDPSVKTYIEYREMLEKENLDAVLVATPLFTHYEIVIAALDSGVHVFCEKTMTMTIEESRNIVKKCNETGKFVQIGHQRHYNPYYNKAMWLAKDKNMIGRITHITAQWHRNESWRRTLPKYTPTADDKKYIKDLDRHVNWRLYNDTSAGLMTELGTHQLDAACWFLGSLPTKVSGFGGIEYWRDDRDAEDHTTLMYEWTVRPGDMGFRSIRPRNRQQNKFKINNPYKVRMNYSSICTNAKSHYGELIQGDRGAFALMGESSLRFFAEPSYQQALAAKARYDARKKAEAAGLPFKEEDIVTSDSYKPGAEADAGTPIHVYTNADKTCVEYDVWMSNHIQWAGFANDVKTNGMPKANQITGLISAICAHKGNEAIRNETVVDIDPKLMAFDFDTPDPHRFDKVEGPKPGDPIPKDGCPAEVAKEEAATKAAAPKKS